VAVTPNESIQRQLSLCWGVTAIKVREPGQIINMFSGAADAVCKAGIACKGDLVVVTAGVPIGQAGTTNTLKVEMI
jgi:pyruvate kinase